MWHKSAHEASVHRSHSDRLERWAELSSRRKALKEGQFVFMLVSYVFSCWTGWTWAARFGTLHHIELVIIALGTLIVAALLHLCRIITEDQLRRLEGRDA
jgi:hypothetical protein